MLRIVNCTTEFLIFSLFVIWMEMRIHGSHCVYHGNDNSSTDANSEDILQSLIRPDDPRLLANIRKNPKFLNPPSVSPYNLGRANIDPSMGQSSLVKQYLKNTTGGFFVECGGYDGESGSNTLDLELNFGWKGLLIEADPLNYHFLAEKNRKSWTSNACLSRKPYPEKVLFQQNLFLGRIYDEIPRKLKRGTKTLSNITKNNEKLIEVQCFPLETFLAALNVEVVDYFSLDIEGPELEVLQTIPFDRILIKVISVECVTKKVQIKVTKFLKGRDYILMAKVDNEHGLPMDLMFAHKSLGLGSPRRRPIRIIGKIK